MPWKTSQACPCGHSGRVELEPAERLRPEPGVLNTPAYCTHPDATRSTALVRIVIRLPNRANGVLVNGNRISGDTPLADGDLIRIGNTAIVYSVTDDPDAQTLTQLLRRHGECRYQTEM